MPHPITASAPERAAIFEREGSNIAIVLFSMIMLGLVGFAGYFLLQSQNAAPVLHGPAIVNAPVHHTPAMLKVKVAAQAR